MYYPREHVQTLDYQYALYMKESPFIRQNPIVALEGILILYALLHSVCSYLLACQHSSTVNVFIGSIRHGNACVIGT